MKLIEEIKNRIDELTDEIEKIDSKIDVELNKTENFPDETLLKVLNKDASWKSAEMFALQWVLESK